MRLIDFIGKKVFINTYKGGQCEGIISDYEYPDENDKNEEFIVLDEEEPSRPVGIYASEIKSIKLA